MFKPMLATAIEDTSTLKFPVLASIKLDGIRATVQGGRLVSRSLKDIPNKHIQERFKNLPEGLDGELIFGDPEHPDCYRTTTSIVMSEDKDPTGVKFWVFDIFSPEPFEKRLDNVYKIVSNSVYTVNVNQKQINNEQELIDFEGDALAEGHEGVMVRSFGGPYKQGRSSLKEGYLLKLKRFKDGEAVITGFAEEMENQNEAKTNLLGRTERSSAKAGLVGKGTLGKFEVRGTGGDYDGIAFEVGGGFTAKQRKQYWKERKSLIGKLVKFKYFPTGSKDKPRFPVFLGFRDPQDL